MNQLFNPSSPEWEEVGDRLNSGHHFGSDGALILSRLTVLPQAKRGDVEAMMLMANVHYSLAGPLGRGNLFNKARAGYHLWKAKRFAVNAFLKDLDYEPSLENLRGAIRMVDMQLKHTSGSKSTKLDYGHIHILMSCFTRWGKDFKRRFRLSSADEGTIVRVCYNALRNGPENLRVLAAMMKFEFYDGDEDKAGDCEKILTDFLARHYDNLMSQEDTSKVDIGLVQTVCRVARALRNFQAATDLAEKYGLHDQAAKAGIGS